MKTNRQPQDLSRPVLLMQAAEECSELAKACLKLARKIDGTNPTPVSMQELCQSITEEYSDVYLSMGYVSHVCNIYLKDPYVIKSKKKRWTDRLNENELVANKMGEEPLLDTASEEPSKTISTTEEVNHPDRYNHNGIEVIDIIDAFTSSLSGVDAFDIGCAIKYLCRFTEKNGVEDLNKAKWYIDHYISNHTDKEE